MMTDEIPIFAPLYKINDKNKILKWQVMVSSVIASENVNNSSVSKTATFEIIVRFGNVIINKENVVEEQKMQVHITQVETGKAGRTLLQQAILEAASKWNKKKNRDTFTEEMTQTTVRYRPMLANTFQKSLYETNNKSKAFKLSFPVLVQRKYDGIRCLSHRTSSGSIVMESRKGVQFNGFPKIVDELQSMYSNILCNRSVLFDGELYTNQLTFENISGLVRQQKGESNLTDLIEYHVYDVFDPNDLSWPFLERMNFLLDISKSMQTVKIVFVTSEMAINVDNIDSLHHKYVSEGYEGIIIRQPSGIYEENKRSKFLQKHKLIIDDDFEIVGFHDGDGHDKSMIIWECITVSGKRFSVKPRGTFEERRLAFQDASSYIGKFLTVVFQELSADGIPRFPVGQRIRDKLY